MWAPLRGVYEPFYNKLCNEALEQANELREFVGWAKLHPASQQFPITVLAWGEGRIEELPSFKQMTSEAPLGAEANEESGEPHIGQTSSLP